LVRPELERRLGVWAPMTIVRGAQGYGKTTLVAHWLAAQPDREVTALWLAGGPGLNSAMELNSRLWECLNAVTELAGSPPTVVDSAVRELDGWLRTTPRLHRVVLVLDDIGHLQDLPALSSVLDLAGRHQNFHVIVCNRGDHEVFGLALTRFEVNAIGPARLLFSEDEVAQLAVTLDRTVPPDEVHRLHEATGGWVAIVKIILEAATDETVPLAAAVPYLAQTVVPGILDRTALGDVMKYAVPERLDLRLVADLCADRSEEARVLASLEKSGFVATQFIGSAVVLVYPSMIRQLLSTAYAARDPQRADDFHRQLATWYAGHDKDGYALSGFRHAIAGHDWEMVLRLWSERGATMVMRDPAELIAALQSLPAEILDANPAMRIAIDMHGVVMTDGDIDGRVASMRRYFEASEEIIRSRLDELSIADLLFLGTGRLIGLRLEGRLDEAVAFAELIDARIADDNVDAGKLDRLSWFHLQAGLTLTLTGDEREARRRYLLAWDYGAHSPPEFIPSNAAANIALTHAVRGESEQARHWLGRRDQFDTSGQWTDYLIGIGAHIANGLLALDRLDERAVRSAMYQVGDGSGPIELWSFAAYLTGQHALYFGDRSSMLARLPSIVAAHNEALTRQGPAGELLTRLRADLLIAIGQGERARAVAAAAPGGSAGQSVPLARVHLLGGESESARAVAVRAGFDDATSVRDKFELALIEAVAALRMNDDDAARDIFGRCLELYRQTGIVRTFSTIPQADLDRLLVLADVRLDEADELDLARQRVVYPDRLVLVALTKRERALGLELERSQSRQEIAAALFVSLNTVKSQMLGLYHKLGTSSREETLLKLRELGLLP
jgi:DNA-binding CsgD family transcriptional regulator